MSFFSLSLPIAYTLIKCCKLPAFTSLADAYLYINSNIKCKRLSAQSIHVTCKENWKTGPYKRRVSLSDILTPHLASFIFGAIGNKLNDIKSKAGVFMKPNLESHCDDYFLFPFRWHTGEKCFHALCEYRDFLSRIYTVCALSFDDARAMANRLIYQTELIRGNEVTGWARDQAESDSLSHSATIYHILEIVLSTHKTFAAHMVPKIWICIKK